MNASRQMMPGSGIAELLHNKSGICVSVIAPMERKGGSERQGNAIRLKNLLKAVHEYFDTSHSESVNRLLAGIEAMAAQVDFNEAQEGIGIFASPDYARLFYFPFPVTERLIISDNFQVREVLRLHQYLREYYVLSVDLRHARLFKGSGPQLEEIRNTDFPVENIVDHEYEDVPPSAANDKGWTRAEKNRAVENERRPAVFFKTVDQRLRKYTNGRELVISGPVKDVALFINSTSPHEKIAGTVEGNFNYALASLATESWKTLMEYRHKEMQALVQKISELKSLLSSDLQEIWTHVKEGRGLKLVVEKDFTRPGFVVEDQYKLFFHPPQQGAYTILPDVVDQIIEMVLEKNGTVEFVENGMLKEYGGIVLISRY